MLCIKRLGFDIKYIIFLHKLGLKHCHLSSEQNLLSKKLEAKSKHFSKTPVSEIFGKPLLLGLSNRYQSTQNYQ